MNLFPKEAIAHARVLVVGDVMLDRYWFGEVERISPEAPVPVVRVVKREDRLGGAANVARNIVALGAKATLVGLVGQDEAAQCIHELLTEAGIEAHLIADSAHPTTLKMRVLGKQQQLLRIDFEDKPTPSLLKSLSDQVEKILAVHDVLVLSDYAKGALAQVELLIELARKKVYLFWWIQRERIISAIVEQRWSLRIAVKCSKLLVRGAPSKRLMRGLRHCVKS